MKPYHVREVSPRSRCEDPEAVVATWKKVVERAPYFQSGKEHVVVFCVNARLKVTHWALISVGTVNEGIAHPRDILAPVIGQLSDGFILLHNHPSGDPSPSEADRKITRRISEAAHLLQVKFYDHIIVGTSYFSFQELGLI